MPYFNKEVIIKRLFLFIGLTQGPGAVFTTLYFLRNLQISPISQCVTLHNARKACQGQTLKLIEPIHKLNKMKCYHVMNTVPEQ